MADTNDLQFRITTRNTNDAFDLDPSMLEILAAVGRRKHIREIDREVNMAPALFKKTFIKLVKMGLIEKIKTEQAYVEKGLLTNIRKVLTRLNGPLGEILLDDTVKEMGLDPDRIPLSTLPNFIETLARTIPGEKQVNEFKKLMLEEMKSLAL